MKKKILKAYQFFISLQKEISQLKAKYLEKKEIQTEKTEQYKIFKTTLKFKGKNLKKF